MWIRRMLSLFSVDLCSIKITLDDSLDVWLAQSDWAMLGIGTSLLFHLCSFSFLIPARSILVCSLNPVCF
jgi:hypothetical protein